MNAMNLPPTKRLMFRYPVLTDAEDLFNIYAETFTMRYRANPPMQVLNDAVQMIVESRRNIQKHIAYRLCVIRKSPLKLVGTVLIIPITNNECKIGLSLGKEYHRTGYGQEILSAMVSYLFEVGFTSIVAISHKDNEASIQLLEKNNFLIDNEAVEPHLIVYRLNK